MLRSQRLARHKADRVTKMVIPVPGLKLIQIGGGKPFNALTQAEYKLVSKRLNGDHA